MHITMRDFGGVKLAVKKPRIYTKVESLNHLYTTSAEKYGDKILFRYFSKEGTVDTLTYAQFGAKVRRIAAGLDALGLSGKRIAISGETSPEWIATYIAVISSGGVIIPLDKELLVEEISNFLNISKAEGIVFSRTFNKKFDDFSKGAATIKYFIPMDDEGLECADRDNIYPLELLIKKGQEKLCERGYELPRDENTERMCCMLFTSGTTGTSKCVMLSEKNICSCVNSACETVDFDGDDVVVSVLPLHHTYELACMLAEINYGIEVCMNDSLKKVLKNFALFKPTGLVLVPLFVATIHKKIWDEAKKKGKDQILKNGITLSNATRLVGLDIRRNLFKEVLDSFGGRLSKIVCGGAPLDPEMVRNFDAFGITLVEGYGITECSPLISVSPYYRQKKGSVGPAVPSCTVMIDVTGQDDKGHDIGEILVKGDNVMLGYYENEEATNEVFTEDGWFRTGDIGYMDKDGYIYITGRKKNVIVLNNGKNVFPEEIEEYLDKIEIVCENVVVGRTNEDTGEVVLTAIIYPAFDKFDTDDISVIADKVKEQVLEVNKLLPSFKQVRNIEIRKTEFEKTSSRKIKRHKIN